MRVRFVLSLLLTICLGMAATAQQAGRIESMKLLTPDVGWAATKHKLFWTTNGGARWSDITPKLEHKEQSVSSVFFLDSSTGWVLLSCSDGRDLAADNSCFELASTSNAGEAWSVTHEKIGHTFSKGQLEDGYGFSRRSWLSFVDPQRGWELLDISTNSAHPSAGEMLRTADGGKTWVPTNDTPTSDHFVFTTTRDGWMAGGKDQELFVTHDAGDSWQKVPLPVADGTQPNLGESINLPAFKTEKEGLVSVQYSVGPVAGPYLTTVVLFGTNDGGKTWKQERTFSRLPGVFISETADSFWIGSNSELLKTAQTKIQLYAEGNDARLAKNVALVASVGAATQLSFVSPSQGWLDMSDRLLATKDAGNTWTDITPSATTLAADTTSGPSASPLKTLRKSTDITADTSWLDEPNPSSGSQISTHLGFDAYNVPPATPTMAAWMSSSPFYDIAIYLQGAKNGHKDPILGSPNGPSWISAVEGQGWGLVPTWVGVQSPCACYKTNPTTGVCTTAYPSVFSSNPSQDGQNEAKAAVSSANALGLTTPIIYKDIENYYGPTLCTPIQQAAAGTAVQAFVSGWVSQLHSTANGSGNYLAGVYGNPKPAQNDFSQAVPIPDDVWVTKTPSAGKPPVVATWNLAPLTDSPWPNSQRLHQFLIGQPSATWGGQGLNETMDYDIDNAMIASANNGVKLPSSYTYTSFNYPGAAYTWMYGINDVWDTGLINGSGEVGQIVGAYEDNTPPYTFHGFLLDGLIAYSSIDYPGAAGTWAYGINNSGQIVGAWQDSNYNIHGFTLSGGNYKSIDYPGGSFTEAYGINDAGQVVGSYLGASGENGFLYYGGNGGKFYSVGYPGADATNVTGINGDATIAGFYQAAPNGLPNGFAGYAIPPTWTGTFSSVSYPGASETYLNAVNNDNLLTGYYVSPALYGFQFSNGVLFTSFLYPGSMSSDLYSVNDFQQAVGYYTNSPAVPQGFVVTPNVSAGPRTQPSEK